jgi:hypothetical protein
MLMLHSHEYNQVTHIAYTLNEQDTDIRFDITDGSIQVNSFHDISASAGWLGGISPNSLFK